MFKKKEKIEIIFVFIYLIEQIALVSLYIFSPKLLPLWIGSFPAIFLTTIAVEKVFMKDGFKEEREYLESKLKDGEYDKKNLKNFNVFKEEIKRNEFFHGIKK